MQLGENPHEGADGTLLRGDISCAWINEQYVRMPFSSGWINGANEELPRAVGALHAVNGEDGDIGSLAMNACQQFFDWEGWQAWFDLPSVLQDLAQRMLVNQGAAGEAKHYQPESETYTCPEVRGSHPAAKRELCRRRWLCFFRGWRNASRSCHG